MTKQTLPKSIRTYIRREKARIRRENPGVDVQKEKINELYQRFLSKKADSAQNTSKPADKKSSLKQTKKEITV